MHGWCFKYNINKADTILHKFLHFVPSILWQYVKINYFCNRPILAMKTIIHTA